jgi:hypothetical protein
MKNCTGNEGGKKRDVRKAKNALQMLRGLIFRFHFYMGCARRKDNNTHAFPIVFKDLSGSMITKVAQELNQHRKSILRLCFERMFVTTHVGRRSKKDCLGSGSDGAGGEGSTGEELGDPEASEEGDFGLEDMKGGCEVAHCWGRLHGMIDI